MTTTSSAPSENVQCDRAVGAVLGGLCFIVPGLVLILALSAVFLASHPPDWILGAAAGAGVWA